MLLDVVDEVAEVPHLRVDRALEVAEAEFEVVAVVQQHRVALGQQGAPRGGREVAGVALVGRRQGVAAGQGQGQCEGHDLGLDENLEPRKG